MWLIWKWRKTKDSFSEIKIEINQKVKIISSLKWTVLGKIGRSGVVELDSQKLMVDGRFCLSDRSLLSHLTVHFEPDAFLESKKSMGNTTFGTIKS